MMTTLSDQIDQIVLRYTAAQRDKLDIVADGLIDLERRVTLLEKALGLATDKPDEMEL